MSPKNRLNHISIEDVTETPDGHLVNRDREIALRDLRANNSFAPVGDDHGPYELRLSIEENRLAFRTTNAEGKALPILGLSLKPYSRLIKDYFMI